VGREAVSCFVTWTGRQWRDRTVNDLLRTGEGGILLLNPSSPFGKVFGCDPPHPALSPCGVCYPNCQTLTYSTDAGRAIVSFIVRRLKDLQDRPSLFEEVWRESADDPRSRQLKNNEPEAEEHPQLEGGSIGREGLARNSPTTGAGQTNVTADD
jgi:hypothetical protein